MGSMRLFIACPDPKLRLALILFLEKEPDLAVVGISDRLTGLFAQLQGSEPDVLLLDRVSPIQSMATLLTDLCNLVRRPKTIVFSHRPEEEEEIIAAGEDAERFVSDVA